MWEAEERGWMDTSCSEARGWPWKRRVSEPGLPRSTELVFYGQGAARQAVISAHTAVGKGESQPSACQFITCALRHLAAHQEPRLPEAADTKNFVIEGIHVAPKL